MTISKSLQAPSSVVMVRPHHFAVNSETFDNAFQSATPSSADDATRAYRELTEAADILRSHGVDVLLFDGEDPRTPDCVFPNNWFSTHTGGHIAVYPMMAPNRRLERRADVLDMLKTNFRVQDVMDYSGLEHDGLYLEGTGAMVLDHVDRIAYAVESERTSQIALERFCTHFNYEPMAFRAADAQGRAVYHTNVLMCIATEFVLIGSSMIEQTARRDEVLQRLSQSGRSVIELTEDQISKFAGNAIELQGASGRILALSETALNALDADQKALISDSATLVSLSIPTIELSGGSVRCTIAGIHLTPRA
ncbi:citrulline utilization hydrolase CtlX [Roseovarius rhodophyticola]|uniref:Arginine deiminase-related protein n=1 Tax=Roseovarius rhodophyticola TaxID=3080827 RepID=A0ABZ2TKU1_9RHOB|nr:arginine deiminase-related protein [Roseovarius sp. W115]MDV2927856.1 arginine deiminase-related protein [Roseovarius sp. W115]